MRKLTMFRRGLFLALTVAVGGLLSSSCSKEDLNADRPIQKDLIQPETRGTDNFHWACKDPNCRYTLNAPWQNYCIRCRKEYDAGYGNYTLSCLLSISTAVKVSKEITGGGKEHPLELQTRVYPAFPPPEWYESAIAMKYYNELINSWNGRFLPGYLDGVKYGWYRTTRSLYPGITKSATLDTDYDKFIISGGARDLTGNEGKGVLDATKAAIDAFILYVRQ